MDVPEGTPVPPGTLRQRFDWWWRNRFIVKFRRTFVGRYWPRERLGIWRVWDEADQAFRAAEVTRVGQDGKPTREYLMAQQSFIAASARLADAYMDDVRMGGFYAFLASLIIGIASFWVSYKVASATMVQAQASQVQAEASKAQANALLKQIELQERDMQERRAEAERARQANQVGRAIPKPAKPTPPPSRE